jgi:hypothetical protein
MSEYRTGTTRKREKNPNNEGSYYDRDAGFVQGANGRWTRSRKTAADDAAEMFVYRVLRGIYESRGWAVFMASDPFSTLDYFVYDDKGLQVLDIEMKHRTHSRYYYPTIWLNMRKANALRESLDYGRRAKFIACWADETCWINAAKALEAPTAIRGLVRKAKIDRPSDMNELVHEIPVEWFRTICATEILSDVR